MNWKNYTEKLNSKTFVLPDGWDPKDKIAEQLECSPEKVDDHLRPALKSGAVIKQQFKVWDTNLKRNVMVWAYQEANAAPVSEKGVEPLKMETITKLKNEGLTWADMSKMLGHTKGSIRYFYSQKK